MSQKRRRFSPEEKVRLLRLHLIERGPVSDICDHHSLNPNVFYRWQKQFFENGSAAFAKTGTDYRNVGSKKLERQNAQLKSKLANKDEMIAEITASHIELKKSLGEI